MNKQQSRWIPLYRVEKLLTIANYIVRKTNTNYTQCIHRMRLRPVKPQCQVEDLEHVDPENFEADPTIPEEEREPQLFDNQVRHHINEDNMQLPITTPDVQSVSFNSNIQTANFSSEDPPIQFHDMTHEPTFDQDAFFVEGSVPSANTQETPESIDTGDYVFSNNSNFLPSDSRFGSNRRYNLRRNDHLALPEKTRYITSCKHQKKQRKNRSK